MHDIDAVAAWYSALLVVPSEHESPRCAFVRTPRGVIIDYRSADAKDPGGMPAPLPASTAADGANLVALTVVHRLDETPAPIQVPLLATISTPWGGHGAAAWGVRLAPATVPSWLDMQVGSPFQQQLQRQSLPPGTVHHRHFSYKGSGDDGTVSLASQMVFSIQARAARVRGHDEDHTGILASPQLTAEIRSATARAA